MKSRIGLSVALLILGASAPAAALELPAQKPGVWQTTMKGEKIPGGSRSYSMCLDAASLAEAKATADEHLKNDCSKNDVRMEGTTWIAESSCTFSGMHVVARTETTFAGDDAFHSEVTSSYDSPKNGKTTSVMSVDGKFLGACAPGQKAGVPEAVR
ncbi:MAG TPA: DUF3617 family protein [Rhodanobacteraceae bacterium]|jgi:hypothetical protein|nr:DUF3617 family protein [Rhodanobacteraceae bacterium]